MRVVAEALIATFESLDDSSVDPEAGRSPSSSDWRPSSMELILEHEITNDEWHARSTFLTEVGCRDEFILLSDVNGLSGSRRDRSSNESETEHAANASARSGVSGRSAARLCRPGSACATSPADRFLVHGSRALARGQSGCGWRSATSGRPRRTVCYENQDPERPR